jgi:tetratricopeptide (TPR) repeat protein
VRRRFWGLSYAALALLGLTTLAADADAPTDDAFAITVFGGERETIHLPLLAAIPAFDRDSACALVKEHNARARELNAHPAPDQDDDDPALDIYDAAEKGCNGTAELDYKFYHELGGLLGKVADNSRTRSAANQMLGAMREALKAAQTLDQSQSILQQIEINSVYQAQPLRDSTMFLIGVEAAAPLLRFCGSDENAVECRRDANESSGDALADAGRWLGRADLLRQAVLSYRAALEGLKPNSSDWIHRHTDIGSTLSYEGELEPAAARIATLQAALGEYDLVSAADPAVGNEDWVRQNRGSILQPLADLTHDRAMMNRAIDDLVFALNSFKEDKDADRQAAASYNLARAYGSIAEWDGDEQAAARAVELTRDCVRLYGEAQVPMSRAFGQIHLAEALTEAGDIAEHRRAGAGKPFYAEARVALDDAEPVLRAASAARYLANLKTARQALASR